MKSPQEEKARLDKVTVQAITEVAQGIETKIAKHGKPEVSFPVRSLSPNYFPAPADDVAIWN